MTSSETLDQLAELQAVRKFWIKSKNRQSNSLGAFIRLSLGWTPDLGEAESNAIKARAERIINAALKDLPQREDDEQFAERYLATITAMGANINSMKSHVNNVELDMKKIARTLPVYEWAKGVRGFGELGLAVIVAEAGDLSNYPRKGHLWKRFGLAPLEGRAMSTWRMKGGLSADDWKAAGYSPRRRSEMYAVIADPLIKCDGPYRDIYLRRLADEHRKALEEGLIPATTGKATVESWEKRGLPALQLVKEIDPNAHRSAGHIAYRANRYMTKILLRDLWREWNLREADKLLPERAELHGPTGEPNERKAITGMPSQASAALPSAHLIAAE